MVPCVSASMSEGGGKTCGCAVGQYSRAVSSGLIVAAKTGRLIGLCHRSGKRLK
jgi:hypothetical protein